MREYPEALINAFLTNYKVKDIAAASGLALSTINKYKNDRAFMAALNERRSAIVEAAVDKMTNSILQDSEVLQQIITDPSVNAGIRVNAINTKWGHLREWKAVIDFEKRLKAIETALSGDFRRGDASG